MTFYLSKLLRYCSFLYVEMKNHSTKELVFGDNNLALSSHSVTATCNNLFHSIRILAMPILQNTEQKEKKRAAEMARLFFPEDHSSIPNTHMVHNHLQLQFQGI